VSVAPEATPAAASPGASLASTAPLESSAEQTAVPTALDPCQLVTAAEASTLAGASYGSGKASTTSGGAKLCTYSSTTAVVNVLVAQAPDAATAQADWTQEQAQAEAAIKQGAPSGVDVTFNVSDTSVAGADQAALATGQATISGLKISISAIYLLKGATFVTFSDLAIGQAAAGSSALQAQAAITLGRVP
jgi:hypothetical protein